MELTLFSQSCRNTRSARSELQKTVEELKSAVARQETTIAQLKKELQATAAHQQKQIEALTAGLQKVSAQLAAASPSSGGLEVIKFATGRIRRGGPATANAPERAVD
jgi:uncharacterized coiled-coil protein SlyX